MRIKAFEKLVFRPSHDKRLLRFKRYKNGRMFCHACGGRRVYRLGEGRFRCRRCRRTFGLFTGSFLALCRVELSTWLWLVKLFELEVTARQAAIQTGLSYPTTLRAFTVIRRAIPPADQPAPPPPR